MKVIQFHPRVSDFQESWMMKVLQKEKKPIIDYVFYSELTARAVLSVEQLKKGKIYDKKY